MPFSCRICGNPENNRMHSAREMMFGTRERFDYLECGQCGTVQIAEIPDLSSHYPEDYYSFGPVADVAVGKNFVRRLAARLTGKYLITGRGIGGRIVVKLEPRLEMHFPISLREPILRLTDSSRILDVGCGTGHLLQTLHYFGFRHLTGADTFIAEEIEHPTAVTILKRPLERLDGPFDLIMMHHSFEHMPEPLVTLREIHRLMADDGFVLLRIPVVSFAWEKYGINWVQLDPPRHLYLYTEKSLRLLAEQAGFSIEKVVYDSVSFQFWGSEQYLRDIPLNDSRSQSFSGQGGLFTRDELAGWEVDAERLNAEGRGDSACFYLRKKNEPRSVE